MNYNESQRGGDLHRDNFLRALSNYSVCMKPYLRNVQDRYIGSFYMPEEQAVDVASYCKLERDIAFKSMESLKESE
jgi:hypothetical protein